MKLPSFQFGLKWLFVLSIATAIVVSVWSSHQIAKATQKQAVVALEALAKRCDPIGSEFDNAGAIRVANMLRHMGENDAKKVLRDYLKNHPVSIRHQSNGLELVVPLVFETAESEPFRMEGGPKIVICNDIPFNTTFFFARNGEPGDYDKYLNDAESKCNFVVGVLKPHMPISGYKKALSYAKNPYSTKFLEQQTFCLLENITDNNQPLNLIDERGLHWDAAVGKFQIKQGRLNADTREQ